MEAQVVVNKRDKTGAVFVNGQFWRKLPKSLIKRDLNIIKDSEKDLSEYFDLLEKKAAEKYVIWLLSKKGYLSSQILEKLKKRGFKTEIAQNVVSKYKKLNFLNDSDLLKQLVLSQMHKGRSRKMAFYKLKMLGQQEEDIRLVLNQVYPAEEEKKVLNRMRIKKPHKNLTFWIRQGFQINF